MKRLGCLLVIALVAGCSSPPPQRYVVFFEEWSAKLDATATGAIAAAAHEVTANPSEQIEVIGFADPTGSPQANVDISRLRAQVVSDALIANGVPGPKIKRSARGATQFTLNGLESRRVEIVVTP